MLPSEWPTPATEDQVAGDWTDSEDDDEEDEAFVPLERLKELPLKDWKLPVNEQDSL